MYRCTYASNASILFVEIEHAPELPRRQSDVYNSSNPTFTCNSSNGFLPLLTCNMNILLLGYCRLLGNIRGTYPCCLRNRQDIKAYAGLITTYDYAAALVYSCDDIHIIHSRRPESVSLGTRIVPVRKDHIASYARPRY